MKAALLGLLASVSLGTAQNAIRQAKRLGLIEVADHRIIIVNAKWSAWLSRGRSRNRKQAPARLW